jgi:branched-chain amino acid transport system ATP-binding protein
MPLLKTVGLCKNFGAFAAVSDMNFVLEEGQFHAIIGPNGAGKSTFFNLISGKYKPSSGEILFRDQKTTNLPPHTLALKGIARSFQITNIFAGLTVFESIRLGFQSRSGVRYNFLGSFKAKTKEIEEKTWKVLEKTNLVDKYNVPACNLPHSEQRTLEIALTLSAEPVLLLLDEPTAGMSPEETKMTVSLIKEISKGLSVILIEHDMDVVFSVSDAITVLNYGRIIAQGSPDDIKNNQEVQEAYLGRSA